MTDTSKLRDEVVRASKQYRAAWQHDNELSTSSREKRSAECRKADAHYEMIAAVRALEAAEGKEE